MDIDQGNTSPRYAVESDDSDDEGSLVTTTPAVSISYGGSPGTRRVTVVLGPVGAEWLRAVSAVGAPKGSVSIGQIYEPSRLHALVSITHRLPPLVSHEVSQRLLSTFPTDMRILDTYSVPSYISSSPLSIPNSPVMFLRTAPRSDKSNTLKPSGTSSSLTSLIPFAPPNLIQSLPASLLSAIQARPSAYSGVLILVPSRHIPPPPPRIVPQPYLSSANEFWSDLVLNTANEALQDEDGVSSSSSLPGVGEISWDLTQRCHLQGGQGSVSGSASSQRGDVGDGGMYL
ncbi:hypothetical protein BS47DRAFT_1401585 [Hydnum rufescens UP504]|uniref:Uncharacterized protein n=1 Tax=Hydnum rufescens UP504 TaxID=1448309 RepID=A0A9P6AG20_9AGAM|nr:hypothetical protein BS47DRAFT_1401585 [Hydnum rufescens UP504]